MAATDTWLARATTSVWSQSSLQGFVVGDVVEVIIGEDTYTYYVVSGTLPGLGGSYG